MSLPLLLEIGTEELPAGARGLPPDDQRDASSAVSAAGMVG